MIEILSKHFKEGEDSKVEKEIEKDASFKEIYERIKSDPDYKMTVLEERIEKIDDTFDKRFEAFKKAVLEAEKNKSPAEKIKQELEEKLKAKKDEEMRALREKADKDLPFWIGSWLFDLASDLIKWWESKDKWFLGSISVWLGVFILWLIWLKERYESLSKVKLEWKPEEEKKEEEKKIPLSDNKKPETNDLLDKKSIYSETGFNIIKFFNPVKFEEEEDPKNIFSKNFKNKNYEELKILYLNNTKNNTIWKEKFNVLHSLFHDYSVTLYETKLTKKNIKDIIESDKILTVFNQEDIDNIKSNNYDFRKLNFEQITKLITLSFKWMFWSSLVLAKEELKWAYNYLFSENRELLWKIKEEINERKEYLIPWNVFEIIKGKDTGLTKFWWKERVNITHEEILKWWEKDKDYNDSDLSKLKKFLNFRDEVLKIPANKSYSLGLGEEFGSEFNSWLNLWKIYILYVMLDWKDINEIDTFEKWNLYFWILEVLKKQDWENELYWKYEWSIIRELINDKTDIFSSDDKKVMKLLAYKILNKSENELKGKITRWKGVMDEYFKSLLPDSYENNTKDQIIDGVEYIVLWLLASYIVFWKKRVEIKIALAASWLLWYVALFLAGKWTLEKLKNSMNADDYQRIKEMLWEDPLEYTKWVVWEMIEENKPNVSLKWEDWKYTTVSVSSMKIAEELSNWKAPKEINTDQLKWDYVFIDKEWKLQNTNSKDAFEKSQETPIYIRTNKWFSVIYKKENYLFDVWPNFLTNLVDDKFDESSDKFNWFDILYNNAEIDLKNWEIIYLWTLISIKLNKINEILRKEQFETDYMGKKYYTIEKWNPEIWWAINRDLILIIK